MKKSFLKFEKHPYLFNISTVTLSPHMLTDHFYHNCNTLHLEHQIINDIGRMEPCPDDLEHWFSQSWHSTNVTEAKPQRDSGQRSKAWFHPYSLLHSVQPQVLWEVKWYSLIWHLSCTNSNDLDCLLYGVTREQVKTEGKEKHKKPGPGIICLSNYYVSFIWWTKTKAYLQRHKTIGTPWGTYSGSQQMSFKAWVILRGRV